jgi:competence protein ComEA
MRKSIRFAVAALAFAAAVLASSGAALAADKTAAPQGKVNINTASVDQLAELPGVGPSLAARIVEYRQKNGGFKTANELLNIKGIGDKSFAKLEPHVTAGGGDAAKGGSK